MASARKRPFGFASTRGDKLAETASQYLTKGRQVFVVGELEDPERFTDRDGKPRVSLEVRPLTITFLGRRGRRQGACYGQTSGGGSAGCRRSRNP